MLGLLGSLVDQSLFVAEPNEKGDKLRYRMLEPVRQYALEIVEHSIHSTRRDNALTVLSLKSIHYSTSKLVDIGPLVTIVRRKVTPLVGFVSSKPSLQLPVVARAQAGHCDLLTYRLELFT